jgi:hypothetical protein
MDYKGHAEICVSQVNFNNCNPSTATAPAAGATGTNVPPVFTQGPDGCLSCVQIGPDNVCLECNHAEGWEMNKTTLTCYEKVVASDDQWMEDCAGHLANTCDICRAGEYVDHATNTIMTY